MKREITIFILNIFIAIGITGAAVNFVPYLGEKIDGFDERVVSVFSPVFSSETKKAEISTTKENENDNTTKASSEKSQDVVNRITGKDSNPYSNITDTPKDIVDLMAKAEKSIKSEEKKGKTSEENYQGGGKIISFKDLAIQSKIPSSHYKPNIEELLKQKVDLSIKDISKPTVLIYHSHTTESYALLDVGYYTKSTDSRSNDLAKNMVRVGDELTAYLEMFGIGVIHDRTIYDKNYNKAYDLSRKAVEKNLEKYPTIDVTIDVHRDDITYKNKTKVKPTVEIDGKKAARMMLIAGCQYNRIKNFPDWETNLRFDLAVQKKVEEKYKGLMRPILFSERKYNMDETPYSFLLEVGTDANTLEEASYSARLFATALAELLLEEYVKE